MQSPIALSMIAAYLIGTTLVGIYMMRRSRAGDDWAVASGQMGVLMIAVGIAGTRVGGAATYGVAGDVITGGVWSMWYAVNTFLALALLGIFYAVPYRRLGIQTVGEVFLQRFDSRRCQWLTSLCVQMEYLIVNIIEPYVIGRILTAMTGLPFGFTVLLSGVIIVSYTATGGIWGSAATNLIHCIAILGGLAAVAVAGLNHLGGWTQVSAAVDAALAAGGSDASAWWSIAGAGWLPVIGMFFAATLHTPAASVYCNFAAAGRNERDVRNAFIWGGIIAMPMPFLAGIIGILTLAKYGASAQLASYQTLTRLAIDINPWIGGVALGRGSGGGRVIGRPDPAVERDDVRPRLDSRLEELDAGSAPARLSHDDNHLRHGRRGDRVAWSDHLDPGVCCCSGSRWWCRRRSR